MKLVTIWPQHQLWFQSNENTHSAGADPGGGGLRVLKHPPKLPKINYVLFNIVNLLSEFRYYQLNNSIIQHPCLLMKLKS